jgi:quinol monooxygenase YgiN
MTFPNPRSGRSPVSFAVIAHYRANPGQEQRVRAALAQMIAPSRAEPGNLLYEVSVDRDDPSAFAAHLASAHFARWLKGEVLPRLASRVRHDLTVLEP